MRRAVSVLRQDAPYGLATSGGVAALCDGGDGEKKFRVDSVTVKEVTHLNEVGFESKRCVLPVPVLVCLLE